MKFVWRQSFFLCLLISISLMFVSCNQPIKSPEINPATPEVVQNSQQFEGSNQIFAFMRDDGKEAFLIKLAENGAKLVDNSEKELAGFTVDEQQKVTIKSAAGEILGYIVPKQNGWKIENAGQPKRIYNFERQDDGNYKLADEGEQEIYRIQGREDGYEIESATKEPIYKIKVKDGKRALINNSQQTVIYTKSNLAPLAVTCFGFDVLSIEQQAALAYAIDL